MYISSLIITHKSLINVYRILGIIFIFLIFPITGSSFASTCDVDFSQITYRAISGDTSYTSDTTNQVIINNNLSSHPLTLVASLPTSNFDCYEANHVVMEISGTISFANDFVMETIGEGSYTANWIFNIRDSGVLTSPLQSFQFKSLLGSEGSDILTTRVDLEDPTITLMSIKRGDEDINLENPVNLNKLKSGQNIVINFLLEDDISINSYQIRSMQGGELVENTSESSSSENKDLFVEVELVSSPLTFELIVSDQFGSIARENFEIEFDSLNPEFDSLEITSYEITSNREHILLGELTLKDDFEISKEDVTMISRFEDTQGSISYEITSCFFDENQVDTLKSTICNFRSQPLEIDSSFTTNFSIRAFDIVRNELIFNIMKSIEIQNDGPEIHEFKLLNPLNNSNILSSLNSENSKIILEYSNDLSSLYLSSNVNEPQRVRVQTGFGPFTDLQDPQCEEIDSRTNRHRCVWEVNPLQVQGLSEFNISIGLRNVLGVTNQDEITIIVDDNVPEISNLRIAERGNERNSILESFERVRIELFVNNIDSNEDFDISINGSNIIFRNSPDSINFACQYVEESELGSQGHICFSDEFELNAGFDGDRTEDLRIIVTNRAGNLDLAVKEVKIFKIHDGDSIEYYDLKYVYLSTPLNRRVVQQQGMDVYHSFGLKPKTDTQEFRIVSVQLLGMGTPEDSDDEDVRLNYFELQNQTSQGVVLGNNLDFFLKSFMPRLLSAHEMEGTTYSTVVLSIVKTDIDTIYKDENVTIRLPIEFYDMPRDLNSNIALAQKILDDIEGVNENTRKGRGLLDIYMMYYNICSVYNGISGAIQSLSSSWNTISLGLGAIAPGLTAPIDTTVGNAAKGDSMIKNMNGIMGKFCMLASCSFSQDLIGGALNSVSGDMRIGDYLTGQRSFLGNMVCRPD